MPRQPHRRGPRRRVTKKIARQRRRKHDAKRRRGEQLEARLLLATDVTGTLTEDATWNGTIRVLGAGVTVADGVTVTIEPGTVIKSELGALVNAVGVIDASGTASDPIIFTSVDDDTVGEDLTPDAATVPLPGAWESLVLGDGVSQLAHVEVRYAGNLFSPGVGSGLTDAVRINGDSTLVDVDIVDSQRTGVSVIDGTPTLDRVRVEGAGSGAAFAVELNANPTLRDLAATGHDSNAVVLDTAGQTLGEDRVWDFGGLPAHFTSDLTIDAGVTVSAVPGSVIKLPVGGLIVADGVIDLVGTEAEPIVFTTVSDDSAGGDSNNDGDNTLPAPGAWEALYLDNDAIRLEHVEVRYAGNRFSPGNGSGRTSAVHVREETSPTLRDFQILDAENTGLYVETGDPLLERVHVEDVGGEAIFVELAADPTFIDVSAVGNGANRVGLRGGTLSENRNYDFGDLPVHLTTDLTIAPEAIVSIAAGSVFKFPTGAWLDVDGELTAVGALTEPIVFTTVNDDSVGGDSDGDGDASPPVPGSWEAVYVDNENVLLERVDVRYAGNRFSPGNGSGRISAVHLRSDASPTLRDVAITDAERIGLYVAAGAPLLDGVRVERAGAEAFYVELTANPTLADITAINNAANHITLEGGVLTEDRGYDFGGLPVHLTTDLTIASGATVSIAAGSVLKFPTGAWFDIDGELSAVGTLTDPIVLTSIADDAAGGDSNGDGDATAPRPGDWEAVYVDSGDILLEHVEVRYAGNRFSVGNGSGRTSAVQLTADAAPTLRSVRVVDAENSGVYVETGSPRLEGITVERAGGDALYVELVADPVFADVAARDNRRNRIVWDTAGALTSDRSWDVGPLPIESTTDLTIGVDATLTLAPGTVIKLPTGAFVSGQGKLLAEGTAEQPVVFTSSTDDSVGGDSNGDANATTGAPGQWEAIYLNNPASSLQHTQVRFAGNAFSPGNGSGPRAAVQVLGDGLQQLTDVEIRDAENIGVYIEDGAPTLERVAVTRAGDEAFYFELAADPTLVGVSAADGAADRVTLVGGTLSEDRSYDFNGLPVHLTSDLIVAAEANVSLAPGTVLKFPTGAFFQVLGGLQAVGTASEPIVLTSLADDTAGGDTNGDIFEAPIVSGAWEALYLDSENVSLDHVQVRYAGNRFSPGNASGRGAAVFVRGVEAALSNTTIIASENDGVIIQDGGRLMLDDSLIVGSGAAALRVDSGEAVVTDTGFFGGRVGVQVDAGEQANVTGSAFGGFSEEAVRNLSEAFPNAIFLENWWGSPDGPNDISPLDAVLNNSPAGESVSDFVSFSNWLTSPPPIPIGPAIASVEALPTAPDAAATELLVLFAQPIDPATFTADDVTIVGAAPSVEVEAQSGTQFLVRLTPAVTAEGDYTVRIGPMISGLGGLEMDQDRDGLVGEALDDAFEYVLRIDATGPRIVSQAPSGLATTAISSIDLEFSEAIDAASLTPDAVTLTGPAGGDVRILSVDRLADDRYRVGFDVQFVNGDYALSVAPVVTDLAGNALDQNANGTPGEEADAYTSTVTIERESLVVEEVTPTVIPGALEFVDVRFSAPIDANTFSPSDVRLIGPAGSITATGVSRVSDVVYRVEFQRVTGDGLYTLRLGPEIADVAGVPQNQDGDDLPGEPTDRFETILTVGGAGPQVTDVSLQGTVAAPVSSISVRFSEPILRASFTPEDVIVTGPSGDVSVTDVVQQGDDLYQIVFPAQTEAGAYTVSIGPNVTDLASVGMDQDGDGVSNEAGDDVFHAMFAIDNAGPSVVGVGPAGPVNGALSEIVVDFDQELALDTVGVEDIDLTGPDGTPIAVTVTPVGLTQLRLRFAAQTTSGDYTLRVGPEITDRLGLAMNEDGDTIAGEPEDAFTTTITVALPDLVVEGLTAPLMAPAGTTIGATWTTTNAGVADAIAPWRQQIVLSGDDVLGNGDDQLLVDRVTSADLAAGEEASRQADVMLPFGLEGSFTLFVIEDRAAQVVESDETNNVDSIEITITGSLPPADLIVDAVLAPAQAGIGGPAEIVYRGRNDGTDTTQATAWTDRIYLSTDTTFNGGDRLLASVARTGTLDANASYTESVDVTIPNNVAPGEYFIVVVTDAFNQVVEPAAEGNNTLASATIRLDPIPLPDLAVDEVGVEGSGPLISGETFTVTWVGENQGQATASGAWSDEVYLSVDDTLSSDDVLLGARTQSGELGVGAEYAAALDATIPEGFAGTAYLIVVPDAADDIDEGDGESTGIGLSAELNVQLFPYADLTVESVTAPPLVIGDPVDLTVSWQVRNVGDGPGRADAWVDRVILSTDGVLGDADDRVIGEFEHFGALPVGSTYERTEILPLPAATNGRFTLFVVTDALDAVFEQPGDEPNSASAETPVDVTVRPYSDLVVESVTTSGLATGGQPFDVTWRIANRGIATTDRDTWTDLIYISSDPTGATGLQLIGSTVRGGALAVDGDYTRTATVTLPRNAGGENYIFVRTGGPYEFIYAGLDQGNQARSDAFDVTFVPPAPVNLRVTDISYGGLTEVDDGSAVEVTWTIRNDGPDDTESGWSDRLTLIAAEGGESYNFGRYTNAEPLAAGQTITRTELVTLPRTSGLFRFFVTTDDRSQVIETNEADNVSFGDTLAINLRARPDLRVTEVEAPVSITAGTIIDVAFTVSNLGAADTPSGGSRWRDRVWLSSSSSSTSGAILLGELPNGSALGFVGSSSQTPTEYRTNASFLVPRAISGNWFVLVETDARSQVDEFPSEGNNRNAAAIAIDANPVPPPDLVVDLVAGPGDAFDDSSITVRYRVSNRGAGPTDPGSWSDQVWLTLGRDGPKPSRGDRFLGAVGHSGVLEVGESYEAEATLRIPQGLTGQFFLTIYADGYGSVFEAAFAENVNPDAPNDLEGSNYGSTPLNVLLTPPADLQVTRVEADPIGTGDEKFSVTWEVTNNGTAATDREAWADAIYLSDDDTLSSDDQLVFALPHSGRLQVGQSYEHTAEFTLPPSAAGSHVLVQTNVDPRIALTDEEQFLAEVRAVLQRIEQAAGAPLGEISVSDLSRFSQTELRAILAGPTGQPAQVYEGPFTENNVGAAEAVIQPAIADLAVTSVVADAASRSGEPIQVSWTVQNQGGSAIADGTTAVRQHVFLSQDPVFDASRASLVASPRHVFDGTLEAGESYTSSAVVATPPGSSGIWYAHVFVNVDVRRGVPGLVSWAESGFPGWPDYFVDRVWEAGAKDDNFRASAPIDVEYAEPNLVLSDLTATPVDPNSGALLDVSFTVTNEGTRETRVDSWIDRVFLSTDTSPDSYDILLGQETREGVLGIGESYEVNLQVRVPDNIGGPFEVIATTDAVLRRWSPYRDARPLPYPTLDGPPRLFATSDAVLEFADEGDNLQTTPVDVQLVPAPDLALLSVTSSERVLVGEDFTFSYSVINEGGVIPDTQTPYFDRVYLSRDRFLDTASDHYVTQIIRQSPLAAGESAVIELENRLPRGLVGTYFVIVVTDIARPSRPNGEVIESDETNNLLVSATPMLIETPPPSDLQVVTIDAPLAGQAGDVLTVTWTVENRGDVPARARIADAVYLSTDAVWDLGDSLLGVAEAPFVRTVAPGESYTASLDFEIPAVLPGDFRLIVRTDIFDDVVEGENNRNNIAFSADTLAITVPQLRLDLPLDDQLSEGVSRLFQIDVEPGKTIRVDLASPDGIGLHELYAAHERLPSPLDSDAAYEGYLRPDQSLLIPETVGGRYFVLARAGVRIRDGEDADLRGRVDYPITMSATALDFGVTDVTPDSGGDDRYVTVRIEGAELPEQAAVRLVRPEIAEHAPVSITRVDATELIAVFDLRDAPHGLYDVEVLHPDGRVAVDPYRFQVEAADPLLVNVGVGGPSQIDIGGVGTYAIPVQSLSNVDTPYTIVEYAFPRVENRRPDLIPGDALTFSTGLRGDAGTVAPLFDSVSTFDFQSVAPELNLDGALTGRGVAIDLPAQSVAEVGAVVSIYPGLAQALEENPDLLDELSALDLDDLAFDFYVVAAATPLSTAEYIDYQRGEAEQLRAAILADADAPTALRSIAGDAEQFAELYLQALADVGLLRAEDTPPLADGAAQMVNSFFAAVGGLLGGDSGEGIVREAAESLATAEQTLGDLVERLREYYGHTPDAFGGGSVADRADYDLGLSNPTSFVTYTLRAGPPEDAIGVIADEIVFDTEGIGLIEGDSVTLVGPSGFGEENFVPIQTPLPYTITTRHDADSPTPAREVRVVVPLDDELDERSVQLADLRLGDLPIELPPGRPNFVGEFDLIDERGYVLQVTAGIDASTRVVSFLLRAVDPLDGLPPVDPTVGLLQPGEELTVGFWAEAESIAAAGTGGELQTGDLIEMAARSIIDGGAPVDSALTATTLDAEAPITSLVVTPLGGNRYQLDYAAADDAGGSGAQDYSVMVATDGGERFRTLRYRTQETSLIYEETSGREPTFLVRAIDAAGNVEAAPVGARTPLLIPDINLGQPPRATDGVLPPPPQAVAEPDAVVPRLLIEAAFGIPSNVSPTQPSGFSRVIRPLAAERLATLPGESGAGIGSLAMAVTPDGLSVLLSGGTGRSDLYRLTLVGAGAGSLVRIARLGSPVYDLVFDAAGQLWASTGGEGLLQIDPTTGAVLDSLGAGVSLGLAAIPGEPALYVATTGGVQRFDTATRTFRAFSETRVDSLALDDDGVLYGSTWPEAQHPRWSGSTHADALKRLQRSRAEPSRSPSERRDRCLRACCWSAMNARARSQRSIRPR